MRLHLTRRVVASAVAVIGLVGGVLAGPATAAPGPWVRSSDILTTFAEWTSSGVRPGLPGNFHRGDLVLVTDESSATIDQFDWDCPNGPFQECTVLRQVHYSLPDGAFVGAMRYHIKGAYSIETYTDDGDTVVTTGYADFSFVRTGPISRSTYVNPDGNLKTVTLTAPMKLVGYLGPTRFNDPTVGQLVGDYPYTHEIRYVRG